MARKETPKAAETPAAPARKSAGPRKVKPGENPAAPAVNPDRPDAPRSKVIALATGYYDHKRRREGDVFLMIDEPVLRTQVDALGAVVIDATTKKAAKAYVNSIDTCTWVERADTRAALRETGAQEALDRKQRELRGRDATKDAHDEAPSTGDDNPLGDS
jgi:hypothetical protein